MVIFNATNYICWKNSDLIFLLSNAMSANPTIIVNFAKTILKNNLGRWE